MIILPPSASDLEQFGWARNLNPKCSAQQRLEHIAARDRRIAAMVRETRD